jgi:homopolymeric O-antigen transport system permease protein
MTMDDATESARVAPGARAPSRKARTGAARLDVLLSLAQSDLHARYGRGPWQLIKWLIDPFAVVGIYLLLITFVLDRGGPAPGLSLACAIVPFQLVMLTVTSGMGAIALRSSILLNMNFDRVLIPAAAALTETVAFAASFLLIALMMAAYGVAPTAAVAWLPLVVVVTIAFAVACAYPSALIGLWLWDLRPFVVSFVRAMYFVAPGLVTLSTIRGRAHDFFKLNPLTGLFEAFRAVLLYGHRPAAWMLLIPLAWTAALLAVGLPLYLREQRQFAKVLG